MREKDFLKWRSIDLSSELSLTYGDNVTYYKSVHHPIPTLPVETGTTEAIFKTNQETLLSIECPDIFFLSDPLTNKHCRIWSSMINLPKVKNPAVSEAKV